jgi:hypothetical protein
MVKGDQKMMLKRFMVTAFACLFVMAFGLGQVAYGQDNGDYYTGTINIKGKLFDWDTKAENSKFNIKSEEAELFVSDDGYFDGQFLTEDGDYCDCYGEMGEQAFWAYCVSEPYYTYIEIADYTYIEIAGTFVEKTRTGKLVFTGNAIIHTSDGVGHDGIKGSFLPAEVPE